MIEYKIELDDLVLWLGATKLLLEGTGVSFVGIEENRKYLPGAFADFDSDTKCGRITCRVSGQFDFEVVGPQEGEYVFYRYEEVTSLDSPALSNTLNDFLNALRASH
jgi:hypothetical protein